MAWSSSSAPAPAIPQPAVSDAAIDALLNEAANALRGGSLAQAAELIGNLVPDLVDHPQRCDLAGLVLLGAEKAQEALVWFDRARHLAPTYWQAQAHAGAVLLALARPEEALEALDAAVAQGFVDAAAYYHRGIALRALGRQDEAIAALDQALHIEPHYAEALRAGGIILKEAGRYEQALAFFAAAVAAKPNLLPAVLDAANLLHELERPQEALDVLSRGLALFPGNADLLNNRGVIFIDTGDLAAAAQSFAAALEAKPDFPEALFNQATLLLRDADPQAALAAFDRAIALKPVYPDAHVGRGVALKELRRFDEARDAFDAAIAQKPSSAHAHNNKGALQLLTGDFEAGWKGYEYRWIIGQTHKFKLEFPIPEWDGVLRAGQKVIAFDEQGIGDTIQFARYLPILAEAGVDVTFFCRSQALRLMRSLPGKIRCLDTFGPDEKFDCQIALSSLPHAFGTKLSNIPAQVPYLSAEPERVAFWRARLAQQGAADAFKIGLCFAGNPNPKADPYRSIPLKAFLPLLALPGARIISLQKVHGLDEISGLPQGTKLETLGEDFDAGGDAFIDTAAVMANLDLIVSCDTSVVHLAGALARPVFTLLKQVPDWRWMLEREDSPWYPTMRLFRQQTRGDWDGVVAEVIAAVEAMKDGRS